LTTTSNPNPAPTRPPRRTSLVSQLPEGPRNLVLALGAAGMAAAASQVESVARLAVGGIGLFAIILIALSDRDLALSAITLWMVFLGFIRRFLIPFAGWSPADPLLLVSPAVAVVLLVTGRKLTKPPRTLMSSVVMFLALWAGSQVFNPNESSLMAPLRATLFYVTPPLWFFVGRTMTLDQHDRVQKVLFYAAMPVVFHGLYQSFVGLLPFEYTWLAVSDIGAAIFLPGFVIRPFSTLVSPQEYGIFLVIAMAIIYSRILTQSRHRGWLVIYLCVSIFALFLQASRTTFLVFLVMMAVLTIVRLRSFSALMGTVAVAAALVLYTASQPPVEKVPKDEPEVGQGTNPAANIRHQLSGFTDPSNSTAPLHIELIMDGIEKGLSNPLGIGASYATLADETRGTDEFVSSENDVANTMAALGLPAGLALILYMFLGFGGARRLWREHGHVRYLTWLGIGVACVLNWYIGGQYTTTMILWMSMGGVARQIGESRMEKLRAIRPAGSDIA
jgi:hypothetical protein